MSSELLISPNSPPPPNPTTAVKQLRLKYGLQGTLFKGISLDEASFQLESRHFATSLHQRQPESLLFSVRGHDAVFLKDSGQMSPLGCLPQVTSGSQNVCQQGRGSAVFGSLTLWRTESLSGQLDRKRRAQEGHQPMQTLRW